MKKKHTVQTHPSGGIQSSVADDRQSPDAANPSPSGTESRLPPEGELVITSFWIVPVRVIWFAAGPMALLLTLAKIGGAGSGWLTVLDAVFWGVVALMICCRWLDQRSGVATNAFGEPSTWADFRRYAVWLSLIALAAWLGANGLGNHVLDTGGSG